MKRPPKYWIEIDIINDVLIVQSDYKGGKRLAECNNWEEAEKLVSDFESGRKTPKWDKNNA